MDAKKKEEVSPNVNLSVSFCDKSCSLTLVSVSQILISYSPFAVVEEQKKLVVDLVQ